MRTIVENYCELPAFVRKPLWKVWHRVILAFDRDRAVTFMNYGYEGLDKDSRLQLEEIDEANRYCIQLYHHVASRIDLKDKEVLEVGSGRGGGGSYIKRYLKPKSYVGIDISQGVVEFCNRVHQVQGLSFVKGEAEKQPFSNESFDAVVNVESARCYANIKTFFSEVYRVLKPSGHFLFADMVSQGNIEKLRIKLRDAGFSIIEESNITPDVVRALDIDHERRQRLIDSFIPSFLKKAFYQFAATKGTQRYRSFATSEMEYWTYLLVKS